ncbi:MAG: hypothetical protein ACLR23_15455 [Clostridia bacterium]
MDSSARQRNRNDGYGAVRCHAGIIDGRAGGHIEFTNIHSRLKILYGESCGVWIESEKINTPV